MCFGIVLYTLFSDPISLVRDHSIKQKLMELGMSVQSYNGDLLYKPWDIYDDKGNAFTTFEAYWNKCLSMQMEFVSLLPPWRLVPAAGTSEQDMRLLKYYSSLITKSSVNLGGCFTHNYVRKCNSLLVLSN